ncbi:hypothetical protein M433DRAFT_296836 [Acidomyces richmondensis BFW]|nr:MAG: hypothetical protein FE78DRAFT_448492 [Acidomyces sp. 'richmondensis']KYG44585.1 hypothetical protein M433DRAFT_296836 [Acidomyces richmondensis BFW]
MASGCHPSLHLVATSFAGAYQRWASSPTFELHVDYTASEGAVAKLWTIAVCRRSYLNAQPIHTELLQALSATPNGTSFYSTRIRWCSKISTCLSIMQDAQVIYAASTHQTH